MLYVDRTVVAEGILVRENMLGILTMVGRKFWGLNVGKPEDPLYKWLVTVQH